MRLLGAGHERRTRRLHLTDARKGIVLATILGPCRAHSPDETVDRIPFNDLRLETVARCDTVNTNVSRRFRGDLTQS